MIKKDVLPGQVSSKDLVEHHVANKVIFFKKLKKSPEISIFSKIIPRPKAFWCPLFISPVCSFFIDFFVVK